jgi:hypothetical protein
MAKKPARAAVKKAPGGISKMEGVRRALSELGRDAKPTQIQGFVQERFGIQMSTDVISTYKGDIARKAAKAQAATEKPPAAKTAVTKQMAPEPQVKAPPTHRANGQAAGIGLKDILAVKDLVTRVGANHLRTLIEVMSN